MRIIFLGIKLGLECVNDFCILKLEDDAEIYPLSFLGGQEARSQPRESVLTNAVTCRRRVWIEILSTYYEFPARKVTTTNVTYQNVDKNET